MMLIIINETKRERDYTMYDVPDLTKQQDSFLLRKPIFFSYAQYILDTI
jgi:hypothetical protein